jgi:preprotein translocase subunit SecF
MVYTKRKLESSREVCYGYDEKAVNMKKLFVLFFLVACIALLISCGTTSGTTEPSSDAAGGSTVDLSGARARAASARDNALSIKADVAAKADFDNAANLFNTAETAADPIATFLESERIFIGAYDKAKALRDSAANELEKARTEIKTAEDEAAAFEIERAAEEAAQGAM